MTKSLTLLSWEEQNKIPHDRVCFLVYFKMSTYPKKSKSMVENLA